MPKRADNALIWRDDTQTYDLRGAAQPTSRRIADAASWPERLGVLSSFAFTSRAGHVCTVRREAAARGGMYWYAYRRAGRRMLKRYLGRSDALTLARLEATAAALHAAALTVAKAPAGERNGHTSRSRTPAPDRGAAPTAPATPAHALDLAPSALLSTRLNIPRSASALVERPVITARLAEGLERALTLVTAPAGFGKTTALAQWARGCDLPVAWVSLDAGDDDPAQFWLYVLAALDRAAPGVAGLALSLLRAPRPAPVEAVLRALLNDIAALPPERHLALVLDDYHRITAAAIHESVALLLEHPPAQLHLYLAGRTEPPLPLARLRVRDQTVELRAPDLRFSPAEVTAFAGALGLALAPGDVAALAERTGGWAAGLRLAGASLQGHPDPGRVIAAFGGSHHDVLTYLGDEVFAAQPAEVQSFLLATAPLDRFCAPLCDAVTSRDDAQALIERLERASLFVIPLDDERRWYRYDALFAELLRHRLHAQMPGRVPVLHRRAATWLAENGWIAEAAEHYFAAGDPDAVARLLEGSARGLIQRSELSALLRLLDRLPSDAILARPALVVYRAEVLLYRGELDATERGLAEAERLIAAHCAGSTPGEPDVGANGMRPDGVRPPAVDWEGLAAMVRGGRAALAAMRGDGPATLAYAQAALAVSGGDGDSYRRAAALMTLAHAYRINGQMRAADTAYDQVAQACIAAGELPLASVAMGLRALVMVQMGRLHAAADIERHIIALADERPDAPGLIAGGGHIGLSQLFYEWNDLDAAQAAVETGIELGERSASLYDQTAGWVTLATIWQARGQPDTALEALRRAERLMHPGAQFPWLVPYVAALRVRLELRQGQIAPAERWAAQRGLLDGTFEPRGPNQVQEYEYLTLARLLVCKGDAQTAAAVVERLLPHAIREERTGSEIELRTLAALAYEADGRPDEALAALRAALELAAPEGYVRLFVDQGALLRALLLRLRERERGGEGQRAAQAEAVRQAPLRDPLAPPHLTDVVARPASPLPLPHPADVGAYGIRPGGRGVRTPLLTYIERLLAAFESEELPERSLPERSPPEGSPAPVEPLSAREREVLGLLAQGRSSQEIADQLVVAVSTVKTHIHHIYAKLQVRRRVLAIARARQLGLLDD